jgi:flagellar motor protein MotB
MISEDDPRVAQIGHPAPPWLINYADLMTELVCFFVILYALSAALNKDMQKAQKVIEEMMKDGQMQGMVKMDKEGLRITLEEQGEFSFFESGSAEITEDMNSKLNKLSEVLKPLSLKNDIVVEGHTDNVPLGSIGAKQFPTNWELSTARATSVVRYFLDNGFPPKRMSAIGYGEFHPISPNDSEANRRKNRRVVFFVKTNPYPDAPAAAKPPAPPGAAAEPPPAAPVEGEMQGAEPPQAAEDEQAAPEPAASGQ